MAKATVEIEQSFEEVWAGLQQLDTWRGVAGIHEMSNPQHGPNGDLTGFDFAIDTPVGRVSDRARVQGSCGTERGEIAIEADQKGVRVRIHIAIQAASTETAAEVEVTAKASSFLTKPLAATLGAALASSIQGEADMIASRVSR